MFWNVGSQIMLKIIFYETLKHIVLSRGNSNGQCKMQLKTLNFFLKSDSCENSVRPKKKYFSKDKKY